MTPSQQDAADALARQQEETQAQVAAAAEAAARAKIAAWEAAKATKSEKAAKAAAERAAKDRLEREREKERLAAHGLAAPGQPLLAAAFATASGAAGHRGPGAEPVGVIPRVVLGEEKPIPTGRDEPRGRPLEEGASRDRSPRRARSPDEGDAAAARVRAVDVEAAGSDGLSSDDGTIRLPKG